MEIVRQVLSVLSVFGLLGAALWALRRGGRISVRGAARKTRSLESIERMALTPQHSLHLVRVRGREIVVATHPQGCAVLIDGGTE
ncbi:MAG TPA: flagellar biosynthetic protein FliO [Bryobacteraceae bacterium]|nr:flagellar biosynthetic protein FliO [Bryobacteraceae bacterium]